MAEPAVPDPSGAAGPVPGDPVALTDLTVITRYSLALRRATAERAELVQVLRDDLEWLTSGGPAGSPAVGAGS